jgi:hypothetical protein
MPRSNEQWRTGTSILEDEQQLSGFHFGFQPSVIQEHLPSPTRRLIFAKWLF